MVGSRWPKLAGSVRALAVVVPGVLVQHAPEVAFGRPGSAPPQDRDLVAQHQQLGVLGCGGAGEQHQANRQA